MSVGLIGLIVLSGCSGGQAKSGEPTPSTKTAKAEPTWVKIRDFGGSSGDVSNEFEIKGASQKIEWQVSGEAETPISITFKLKTGDYGIKQEPTVVVPEATPGQRSGTTRALLRPGSYTMEVSSAGSWSIRFFEDRS